MTPIETLKHEHEVIHVVIGAVERQLKAIDSGEAPDLEKLEEILEFARNFVDRCHHTKEEKHLFVAMVKRGMSAQSGPIAVMLSEHDQGRGRVRAIAEAMQRLEKGDNDALAAMRESLNAYCALLCSHIDKEDIVLFPMAENILTPQDQKALSAAFDKVEREEIGEGVHEKYHQLAHKLAEG